MWLFFYDCHSVNYILKRLLVIFRQIWRRTSMKFVPRYGFFVLAFVLFTKKCVPKANSNLICRMKELRNFGAFFL